MIKKRKIVLVVGKTGYGKSYMVKSVVKDLERVVIFDLMDEYNDEPEFDFSTFDTYEDVNEFVDALKDIDVVEPIHIRLVFTNQIDYETALEACYIVGNMVCVIEEISNFSSAYAMSECLEKIVRFGRHQAISIVGITQRFSDIGVLLRNNADMIICFQLTMPNDIKYLSEISYIGEAAYKVPTLTKRQALVFDNTH